jgi:ABC-type multidrug transport system ATPase subunit
MTGGNQVHTAEAQVVTSDQFVLRLSEVGRRYGRRWALHPTSLDLRPGRILGVVGPNGAGKTTLLSIALGVLSPSTGTVRHISRRSAESTPRIGAVLELDGLLPGLSAVQNLRQWGSLVGITDDAVVGRALADVGLDAVGKQKVRTFSLGMRRRLALARALLADPELLILDEPSNGLDPSGVATFGKLLRGRAASGLAVILSSHSLENVDNLCDDVVYLSDGRIELKWDQADARWWRIEVAPGETELGLKALAAAHIEAEAETGAEVLVRQAQSLGAVFGSLEKEGVQVRQVTDLGRDLARPFRAAGRGWGQ